MGFDSTNLLAMGLIFLGSYVQTAIGFGLAIVAAPLLILWAPEYVPAPICLVALFISLMNAMKHMYILLADAKEYKMTQTQFQLFKFQNFRIEYCLGFVYLNNQLIISYSCLDRKRFISIYELKDIQNNLKWYFKDTKKN